MTIAAEVAAGLAEAGVSLTGSPLVMTFERAPSGPEKPWDTNYYGEPVTYTLTGIDMGIKEIYVSGSSATRKARMLMVDATGTKPEIGDRVTIGGASHDVLAVMPFAPAGEPIFYKVELST